MGSRGQAIKSGGFTVYNYKTLMRYNNTRFIMLKNKSSIKTPEMSNSKWAVYATLSKSGEIQAISFYNGSRRKYKEIDFLHAHNGLTPHSHAIDPKNIDMRKGKATKLTKREQNRVYTIMRFYKKHDLKSKYMEEKTKYGI